MMSNFKIETRRLLLRPFNMDDVEPFAVICSNPDVMRFIGNGQPLNTAEVKTRMTTWISSYEQYGYGLLALTMKETSQLIGFCGLIEQTVDEENHVELGYRLDQAFWGSGIATEAAMAVKDYAFNQLKMPSLISIIHHENLPSKRVAQKVGMTLMKKTYFKDVLVDIFFMINQKESLCLK